jgi:hypothetical protein
LRVLSTSDAGGYTYRPFTTGHDSLFAGAHHTRKIFTASHLSFKEDGRHLTGG